jgi:excisionase family DNA binding protein
MNTLLMSVEDVAQNLRMTERHIRQFIARGQLPTVRIGRRVLVEPTALTQFVHEQNERAARRTHASAEHNRIP